jgi:hypothetical protein
VVPALADAERMGMTGRNHQLSLKVKREAAERFTVLADAEG